MAFGENHLPRHHSYFTISLIAVNSLRDCSSMNHCFSILRLLLPRLSQVLGVVHKSRPSGLLPFSYAAPRPGSGLSVKLTSGAAAWDGMETVHAGYLKEATLASSQFSAHLPAIESLKTSRNVKPPLWLGGVRNYFRLCYGQKNVENSMASKSRSHMGPKESGASIFCELDRLCEWDRPMSSRNCMR